MNKICLLITLVIFGWIATTAHAEMQGTVVQQDMIEEWDRVNLEQQNRLEQVVQLDADPAELEESDAELIDLSPEALMGKKISMPDVEMALYPRLLRAQRLIIANNMTDAIRSLGEIVESRSRADNAERAAAYFWLGEVHTANFKLHDAAKNYLEGFKADQTGLYGGYNLYALGHTMRRLGKNNEACEIFGQFVDRAQQDDNIYSEYLLGLAKDFIKSNCGRR